MTASCTSAGPDGMYSQLIEDEVTYDNTKRRPDVRLSAPVRLAPGPGPGPYRLATICLATLCGILLISIIAVTAHYKNKPQGEVSSETQKQTQDANVSALNAAVSKLHQENEQLQRERDELLAKLATKTTTKAPVVIKATTAVVEPPAIVCPTTSWHMFNNSCYLISKAKRSWHESQTYCQTKGAHLAIIHTAEEQTFLWDLLPRGYWNAFWFGITDEHAEEDWKWVDGTPLVGGFWEVGEPNNHIDEDCGYIVKTQVLERVATRSWIDAPCAMSLPFICEKEMIVGAANGTTATSH